MKTIMKTKIAFTVFEALNKKKQQTKQIKTENVWVSITTRPS